MDKQKFLKELDKAASGLPKEEREELLQYYDEYLTNALLEGKSEETIRQEIGSPAQIAGAFIEASSEEEIEKKAYKRMARLGWLKRTSTSLWFAFLACLLLLFFLGGIASIVFLGIDVVLFQQIHVFQIFMALLGAGISYLAFLVLKILYKFYLTRKGRFS